MTVANQQAALLDQYQIDAARTCVDSTGERDTQHHVWGVFTEAGELIDQLKKHVYYGKPIDRVNIVEESGDVMWYVANLCRINGLKLSTVAGLLASATSPVAVGEAILPVIVTELGCTAGSLIGIFLLGYGKGSKDVGASAATGVAKIIHQCSIACLAVGSTLDDALKANIAKLQKRFPDKFNLAERALNRDLVVERATLEAHAHVG